MKFIQSLKRIQLIAIAMLTLLGGGTYSSRAQNATPIAQQAYINNQNFGSSVAISGDTVLVGARWESSNATGVNGNQSNNSASAASAVYVFVRSGTNWTQQAYLKASNTGAQDIFGGSLAISGDTLVISAGLEDSNATGINGNQTNNSATDSGAAYVFVRNGTNWIQQAYLKASNTGQLTSSERAWRFLAIPS